MNTKNIIIGIVVIAIILGLYFIFKPEPQKPNTIYIKGKDSVVTKNDTIIQYVPKYIATEKIVTDTVHIMHFNSDSSIVRDTVIYDLDTAIAQITTYPRIDSLKLNLDLRLQEKIINIKDSIWITRVDTLKTTIIEQKEWYNTFVTGFGSAIVTFLGILLIL